MASQRTISVISQGQFPDMTHDRIQELPEAIGFVPVDEQVLIGEPDGVPTTCTLINDSPLMLQFKFRVDSEGTETEPMTSLLDGVPEDQACWSFEENVAYLSLYNLDVLDNSAIRVLIDQVAATLNETDFALPSGCLKCGREDCAELTYVDGIPTRICVDCLTDALEEKQETEEELNRPSFGLTLGLPGAFLYGSVVWALSWALFDWMLDFWNVRAIWINRLTVLLGLIVIGVLGYVIGSPMGATLRRSIAVRHAPRLSSLLFALGVAAAGEILAIAVFVFRKVGIFDLALAAQIATLFVTTWTAFWVICKLGLTAAIGYFCYDAASKKQRVQVQV